MSAGSVIYRNWQIVWQDVEIFHDRVFLMFVDTRLDVLENQHFIPTSLELVGDLPDFNIEAIALEVFCHHREM